MPASKRGDYSFLGGYAILKVEEEIPIRGAPAGIFHTRLSWKHHPAIQSVAGSARSADAPRMDQADNSRDFDQKSHWNRIYQEARENEDSLVPNEFARETANRLRPPARVLELGCGRGRDAAFFARLGFDVTAIDFSEVAVARSRTRFANLDRLALAVVDLAALLPFLDGTFDLVYVHLSLHYFRDVVTRRLFGDIWRVLKSHGLLCFMCKSIRDPLYGLGEMIEPDMFVYQGHVRHFFSEEYARACLASNFQPEFIESIEPGRGGQSSAFVKVIARKMVSAEN